MRAREFISEQKVGDIGKRRRAATVGLHTFRDNQFADRIYELNRVMMAVAQTDGKDAPITIDSESWSGRNNVAAPYTPEEHEMLKKAFKAVGTFHQDLNHGDLDSEELPDRFINKASPIKAFKGYPR
jgi:hypothetical protein